MTMIAGLGGMLRVGAERLRRSQIAGPGLVTMIAIIVGIGATFLGQMLISRHLGVRSYGYYSILVSWAMLVVLPASIGLDGAIMRFMPIYLLEGETRRYRRLIMLTVTAQILGVAGVVGLLVLGASMGIGTLAWARTGTLIWVAVLIGATVIGNTAAAVLQAARRVIVAQIFMNVVRPLVVVILVASLIYLRPVGYDAADLFRVTAGAALLAVIPLVIHIARAFFTRPVTDTGAMPIRQWLTFGLFNLTAGVGQQALIQLPILIVGTLGGTDQAGHYGVASRLASTVSLGLAALAMVSLPLIATAFAAKDQHEVRRIARLNVRLSFGFAVLATLAIIVAGRWVLAVFGPGFVDAYPTLIVLMIGLTASSALGVATGVVAMGGHPSVIAIANALGVVVLGVAAYALVPIMGTMGGAVAYGIANMTTISMIALFAYRRLGINTMIFAK